MKKNKLDNHNFWIFFLVLISTLYVSLPLLFLSKWSELLVVVLIFPFICYKIIIFCIKKREEYDRIKNIK